MLAFCPARQRANLRTKHLFLYATLCIFCVLAFSGCSVRWKNTAASNADANLPRPTAQQLLTSLQKNFKNVSAFHVVMQVQNPGPITPDQVQIRMADGDVGMPDKVKAQATVVLSGQSVTVNLISIGNNQYITDPITGQWRIIKGVLDPRTLTNPDTGIISILNKFQDLSEPTSDVVNKTPCWRIQGTLAAKELAFFTGGGVPDSTKLKTNACIGKADSLPYQVNVVGMAARGDTDKTTRTFVLSNYNQRVTIVAPI